MPRGARLHAERRLLTAMQHPFEIAKRALAQGMGMLMMVALSCGATGLGRRGT
jgi:hypothetical protein